MKSSIENKENDFLPYYIPFPALKIRVNVLGRFLFSFIIFFVNF